MVDAKSRQRLGEALRHYVAGLITNDDLDALEVDWRDSGAVAVKEVAWNLYDDTNQHLAEGKHRLNREARREIARWILFLHSNTEYTWPNYSFTQVQACWPLNVLTFGRWEKRRARRLEQFKAACEYAVWPFAMKDDFLAALRRPRLLSNGQAQK